MNKYIYLICFFSFTLFVNAQEKTMEISLEDAINFALQNSYNSAVANNDILSAEKTKWETTTMGLPQINAKVDYQNFLKQQEESIVPTITAYEKQISDLKIKEIKDKKVND